MSSDTILTLAGLILAVLAWLFPRRPAERRSAPRAAKQVTRPAEAASAPAAPEEQSSTTPAVVLPTFARIGPYLLIAMALYAPVTVVLATSQIAWLTMAWALLAVSVVLFTLARRGPIQWTPVVRIAAGFVAAVSFGAVQNAFWRPSASMQEVLVGSAWFIAFAVIWLVVVRLLDRGR